MPDPISGVSGNSNYPDNTYLVQIITSEPPSECRALVPVPKEEDEGKVVPLELTSNKSLFGAFRRFITDIDGLKKFMTWAQESTKGDWRDKSKKSLVCDELFGDAINDSISYYSKQGIELVPLLKEMLVENKNFEDKALIVRMLVSIGLEDELIKEFFVPALELRKNMKNLEMNNSFCCNFLGAQDDLVKKDFFHSIDYSQIMSTDNFAASTLKVMYPDVALKLLLEIAKKKNDCLDEEYSHRNEVSNIHKIFIYIVNQLVENDVSFAEGLYKSNTDREVGSQLFDTLITNFKQEAPRIFRETMEDDSDLSYEARIRRFYAINHFVRVAGGYGTRTMKDFVLKEKDPFLVFYASYMLSNFCGVDGTKALTSAIVNNVRENQLSLPLAAITRLSEDKEAEVYSLIFKDLIIRNYKEKYDLRQAFLNLSQVPLPNLYVSDDGIMTFSLADDYNENLIIDLISNIGIEKFLKWVARGEGVNEHEVKNVKRNAIDLLKLALEVNPERMRELMIKASVNERENFFKDFYGLIGMSEVAKTS